VIRRLNIRQRTEAKEKNLSPFAAESVSSRGRARDEETDPIRTAFQRDRDRIIHCKAFRRLKHKTQVFIAPLGDHYVTRLTHTLEVAQIARTISRALDLNEDLTEAIALGHDLGHTPFGHVGENVLNELSTSGFNHNEQSLRVVDLLEKEGRGLNLTWEVRDGILNHSKTDATRLGEGGGAPGTLEGEVCKFADAIAYINHDIDDALRADIISEDDLPPAAIKLLGRTHSQRINTMVSDMIVSSWEVSGQVPGERGTIRMSTGILDAANLLRDFLFKKVYNLRSALSEAEKAREVIRQLYRYFGEKPDSLPAEYSQIQEDPERMAIDYIAGMTDHYAFRKAEEIGK